jgi:hypothetical protein
MNEFFEVLKNERQRQIDWFKTKHDSFARWLSNNSYHANMPKDYILPKPMIDKYVKLYRVLFIVGIILAFWF